MTTVKLSKKNQMVLPKEAREHLGVGPGDELLVIQRRNGTVLIAKSAELVRSLRGSGKGAYGRVDRHLRRERGSWR
ncbi:MAG TPA: AbrB/MazE/SpoVT family DNA-binding domain-containing protein [Phycisphaerae bacterium]|nr:AbrB/MazE/SpoVT family DNA-binding domain-containing protein [Phycisphaerae bacterium]